MGISAALLPTGKCRSGVNATHDWLNPVRGIRRGPRKFLHPLLIRHSVRTMLGPVLGKHRACAKHLLPLPRIQHIKNPWPPDPNMKTTICPAENINNPRRIIPESHVGIAIVKHGCGQLFAKTFEEIVLLLSQRNFALLPVGDTLSLRANGGQTLPPRRHSPLTRQVHFPQSVSPGLRIRSFQFLEKICQALPKSTVIGCHLLLVSLVSLLLRQIRGIILKLRIITNLRHGNYILGPSTGTLDVIPSLGIEIIHGPAEQWPIMRCLRKSNGPFGAMPQAFWSACGLPPLFPSGLARADFTLRLHPPPKPAGKRQQAACVKAAASRSHSKSSTSSRAGYCTTT